MFQVIVDNDQIASKILSMMKKHKLPGEVTFIPLNTLRPNRYKYPNIAVSSNLTGMKYILIYSLPPPPKDAVPLYEQLQYNPMFGGAVELIFGGILLCRDMDKASQMSKSARMDCITLEGGHYIEVLD